MIWGLRLRYPIEEGFTQLASPEVGSLPRRSEFQDPCVASFQRVTLSRLIDQELERFYTPVAGNVISRVFRRLRGR